MVEAGEDPDLPAKPARIRRGGDLRPEQLQRHRHGRTGGPARGTRSRPSPGQARARRDTAPAHRRRPPPPHPPCAGARCAAAPPAPRGPAPGTPGSSSRIRVAYCRAARAAPTQSPAAARARTRSAAGRSPRGSATASRRLRSISSACRPSDSAASARRRSTRSCSVASRALSRSAHRSNSGAPLRKNPSRNGPR